MSNYNYPPPPGPFATYVVQPGPRRSRKSRADRKANEKKKKDEKSKTKFPLSTLDTFLLLTILSPLTGVMMNLLYAQIIVMSVRWNAQALEAIKNLAQ